VFLTQKGAKPYNSTRNLGRYIRAALFTTILSSNVAVSALHTAAPEGFQRFNHIFPDLAKL